MQVAWSPPNVISEPGCRFVLRPHNPSAVRCIRRDVRDYPHHSQTSLQRAVSPRERFASTPMRPSLACEAGLIGGCGHRVVAPTIADCRARFFHPVFAGDNRNRGMQIDDPSTLIRGFLHARRKTTSGARRRTAVPPGAQTQVRRARCPARLPASCRRRGSRHPRGGLRRSRRSTGRTGSRGPIRRHPRSSRCAAKAR
jgi:hypothetical protein